jgi:hypothetical protein
VLRSSICKVFRKVQLLVSLSVGLRRTYFKDHAPNGFFRIHYYCICLKNYNEITKIARFCGKFIIYIPVNQCSDIHHHDAAMIALCIIWLPSMELINYASGLGPARTLHCLTVMMSGFWRRVDSSVDA